MLSVCIVAGIKPWSNVAMYQSGIMVHSLRFFSGENGSNTHALKDSSICRCYLIGTYHDHLYNRLLTNHDIAVAFSAVC